MPAPWRRSRQRNAGRVANAVNSAADRIEKTTQVLNRTTAGAWRLVDHRGVSAGGLRPAWSHWRGEAVSRVRSHISPGPYRSFRELSLARSVNSVTWCPPTFVGTPGSSAPTAIAASHFSFGRRDDLPQLQPPPPSYSAKAEYPVRPTSRLWFRFPGILDHPPSRVMTANCDSAHVRCPAGRSKAMLRAAALAAREALGGEQRAAAAKPGSARAAVRARARHGGRRLFADPQRDRPAPADARACRAVRATGAAGDRGARPAAVVSRLGAGQRVAARPARHSRAAV